MPQLCRHLTAAQHVLLDSEAERLAEGVRLFMPSDILDKTRREKTCTVGLPEVEAVIGISSSDTWSRRCSVYFA
jgi:hypothetical protein